MGKTDLILECQNVFFLAVVDDASEKTLLVMERVTHLHEQLFNRDAGS